MSLSHSSTDGAAPAWPKLLRVDEVAELTGIPVTTLRRLRFEGRGPKSFKLGGRIVYKEADVRAWVEDAYRAADTA